MGVFREGVISPNPFLWVMGGSLGPPGILGGISGGDFLKFTVGMVVGTGVTGGCTQHAGQQVVVATAPVSLTPSLPVFGVQS